VLLYYATYTTASALISTDTSGSSSSSGTLTSSSANSSSDNQLYKALQLRTDVAGCLADLLQHNMYAIMHGQQGASMKEEVNFKLLHFQTSKI
jgi:hypothetical protein